MEIHAEKTAAQNKSIINSILIFALGLCLGVGSKILDMTASNELPIVMQMLDITNFLGRFAPWIFLAVCVSVGSRTAKRASINVFLFFLGMVGAYYLWSALAAGFFPAGYAMIWFGVTAVSPLLAWGCWHAKREGWIAVVISGVIVGVLFSQAILLFQGVRIAHLPEVIVWLLSLIVLRRKPKEFAAMIAVSLITAAVWQLVVPYWG